MVDTIISQEFETLQAEENAEKERKFTTAVEEGLITQEPQFTEFNLNAAFNSLVNDKNYTRKDATDLIAQTLAKNAGLNDDQFKRLHEVLGNSERIVSRYTGAKEVTGTDAFLQGFGRELPVAYAASKAFVPTFVHTTRAVSPVGGPVVGTLAGLTTGIPAAIAGGLLTDEVLSQGLGWEKPYIVPSKLPFYEAGRTAGGFLASIPASVQLLKNIPEKINLGSEWVLKNISNRYGNYLKAGEKGVEAIGTTARTAPLAIAGAELAGVPYPTIGGGIAEQTAPGEIGPRLAWEIIPSIINPTNIVKGVIGGVFGDLKKSSVNKFSAEGRQSEAEKWVFNWLNEVGTDAETGEVYFDGDSIIKWIEENPILDEAGNIVDVELTPGQYTGNPALIALERSLFEGRDKSKATVAGQEGLLALSKVLYALERTGDPDALQYAAKIRENYTSSLIQGGIDRRVAALKAAHDKALQRGDETVFDLSAEIKKVITDSQKAWRNAEKTAWNKVPLDEEVQPINLLTEYAALLTKYKLPSEKVDGVVNLEIRKMLDTLTSDEITTALNVAEEELTSLEKIQKSLLGSVASSAAKDSNLVERFLYFQKKMDPYKDVELHFETGEFSDDVLQRLNEYIGKLESNADDIYLTKAERTKTSRFLDKVRTIHLNRKQIETAKANVNNAANMAAEAQADVTGVATVSWDTLKKLRTRLNNLSKQRELRDDAVDAALYGKLARAIDDDLGIATAKIDPANATEGELALLNASAVTKGGHDVFDAVKTSQLLSLTQRNDPKFAPENTWSKFFEQGDTDERQVALLAAEEFDQAAKFFAKDAQGNATITDDVLSSELRSDTYNNALEQIYRRVFNKAAIIEGDGPDQRVVGYDQKEVDKFITKHRAMLETYFPNSLNDLQDVSRRNAILDSFTEQYANPLANASAKDRYFSAFLEGNPSKRIAKALASETPVRDFNRLARIINTRLKKDADFNPDEVKEAFKSAVYDWAFTSAGLRLDEAGEPIRQLTVQGLKDALFSPLKRGEGKSTLAQLMLDAGIVEPGEVNRLRQLTQRLGNIEDQLKSTGSIGEFLDPSDPIYDFAIRVAGARAAGALVPGSGGAIQIPAAGAKLASEMFNNAPNQIINKYLVEMVQPQNMETFLAAMKRGKALSAKENKNAKGLLSKLLIQIMPSLIAKPVLGATPLREAQDEVREATPLLESQQVRPLQRTPDPINLEQPTAMTTPPAAQVAMNMDTQPTVPVSPPTAPPASPQQRQQYAAMYPFDTVSDLIRTGRG
jgi:hypothetical protein